LNATKNWLAGRVMQHWIELPREMVTSPSPELFESQLGEVRVRLT